MLSHSGRLMADLSIQFFCSLMHFYNVGWHQLKLSQSLYDIIISLYAVFEESLCNIRDVIVKYLAAEVTHSVFSGHAAKCLISKVNLTPRLLVVLSCTTVTQHQIGRTPWKHPKFFGCDKL